MRSQTKWLACTAPAGENFDTGASAVQATYVCEFAGRVRHVDLFLPDGSTGELHVIPYVVGSAGARVSAVGFGKGGNQYLSGNNTNPIAMDADFPVGVGDVIQAWYDNGDAVNPHWFALAVTIVPDAGGVG